MEIKFTDEKEICVLLEKFENASIDRDEWKHAEHLTVALVYIRRHDLETATAKMRDGIFNLLLNGFGIDPRAEMPYHETLTVFWMRTVAKFNESKNGTSLLDTANELAAKFDKDYPLRFYSRERLFSDEARSRFIEGDLT